MKLAASLFAFALLAPVLSAQEKPDAAKDIHTYRVTYTLIETEAGKKIGTQKASTVLDPGPRGATIKLGSRIPIATGNYSTGDSTKIQTQFTYLDIGLNINTVLSEMPNGVEAVTKIEQLGMVDASPATPQDPIIRQTSVQGSAVLTLGKSMMIGSLDMPASTRHTDIEILLERVP